MTDTSQLKQQVADQIRALISSISAQVADGVSLSEVKGILVAVATSLISIARTLQGTTGAEKKALVDELFAEIYKLHIAPKWDAPGPDVFADNVILAFFPMITQLVYDAMKATGKLAAVLALLLIPLGVAEAGPVICRDGTCYQAFDVADQVSVVVPNRERPLFRRAIRALRLPLRCCR